MTFIELVLDIAGWIIFYSGIDFVKKEEIGSWKYYVGKIMIMIGLIAEITIISTII